MGANGFKKGTGKHYFDPNHTKKAQKIPNSQTLLLVERPAPPPPQKKDT